VLHRSTQLASRGVSKRKIEWKKEKEQEEGTTEKKERKKGTYKRKKVQ
jgi:hypothetical protein